MGIVAKELLSGQKIVIVRCDEMAVSGSLVRNRVKYAQFRKKRCNTNPRQGPFHFKGPAKMVWRTIRGMVHHKSQRGQEALAKLSTFEGIPQPYDKMKRKVVPAALRILRLKQIREFTVLGDLANAVGWKHQELLKKLEEKRKVQSQAYFEKKKEKDGLRRKATAAAAGDLKSINTEL